MSNLTMIILHIMNDLFFFLHVKAIWQPKPCFHYGCARYSNQLRGNRTSTPVHTSRKQCEPVKLNEPARPHHRLLQQGKGSSREYAFQLAVSTFLCARSKMQNRFLAEQCGRSWKKEMAITYYRTRSQVSVTHRWARVSVSCGYR